MTMENSIDSYPETHQFGRISIENLPENKLIEGDLGIQIAEDGRVWVCINGIAFIRFKPIKKEK
jgi:hypothetical protein